MEALLRSSFEQLAISATSATEAPRRQRFLLIIFHHCSPSYLEQGSANFSLDSKHLDVMGHTVSIAITQLHHCSMKATIDDMQTEEHG